MLKTKDDINAQKGKHQQVLIPENRPKQTNIFQNPKIVYFSFFITMALSAFFWVFSEISSSVSFASLPQIHLPKLSLSWLHTRTSFDAQSYIKRYIDTSNGFWAFYFQSPNYEYLKNVDQFNQPISGLKNDVQELPSSTHFTTGLLPLGIDIKEKLIEGDNTFQVDLFVTTPSGKQIFIFVKVSAPSDLQLAKSQLRKFIPDLYWQLVQQN